jgi:sulfite reductase (NADPH) flavoprotein alpha-component
VWDLLRPASDGGAGAHAFLAGRDAFVARITTELSLLAGQARGGADAAAGWAFVRDLVAERRLSFQIAPTPAPWRAAAAAPAIVHDASAIVEHNSHADGYWLTLDGNVYDMTVFRHLHPGGSRIVDGSAGMDATGEYSAVLHYRDAEINAMLAMFKIGEVRRLQFGGAAGARLHDLYRAWVRFLFLIVEMQNAYENDLLYLRLRTTAVEAPDQLTPLKLMMFENTHGRFVELYYTGLTGPALTGLWQQTVERCEPGEDRDRLERELADSLARGRGEFDRSSAALRDLWVRSRTVPAKDRFWDGARETLGAVSACDRSFLAALKATVRAGVQVFERHERDAPAHGGALLDALLGAAGALDGYHGRLAAIAFAMPQAATATGGKR